MPGDLHIHPDGHVVFTCPHCNIGSERRMWADEFEDGKEFRKVRCDQCNKVYKATREGDSQWWPNGWHWLLFIFFPGFVFDTYIEAPLKKACTSLQRITTLSGPMLAFVTTLIGCFTIGYYHGDGPPGSNVASMLLLGVIWSFVLREPLEYLWRKIREPDDDTNGAVRMEDKRATDSSNIFRIIIMTYILFGAVFTISFALAGLITGQDMEHMGHFCPEFISYPLMYIGLVWTTADNLPPSQRTLVQRLVMVRSSTRL